MFHVLDSGKYIKVGPMTIASSLEFSVDEYPEEIIVPIELPKEFTVTMTMNVKDYKAMIRIFGFDPWRDRPNNWRRLHGLPMRRENSNKKLRRRNKHGIITGVFKGINSQILSELPQVHQP
jgi:hypothetical protein